MPHKNSSRLTLCAKRKGRTQIAKRLARTRKLCRNMPQETVKNSLNESVVDEVDITFDDDVLIRQSADSDYGLQQDIPDMSNSDYEKAKTEFLRKLISCDYKDIENSTEGQNINL
ncbi:hypothetical protein ILUMI_10686 [Ignelater luminosus]|uniref:Uncharacterized protein n=1 Tax=Ignelater luminosus TaxID=2038154 RepID=A0A8K0CXF7_IGNLU|nr:hypothetical protein ILUMI_10686 [Ignelater luminosus]